MIYIPLKYLKPGMVTAKSMPSDRFFFSLVTAGQTLTPRIIQRLAERGVQGAYIESTVCSDAVSEDFIDPVFKAEILTDIKKVCDSYLSDSLSPGGIYSSVSKMATDLVSYVLTRDAYLVNMIDIRDYDSYTYSHSLFVGILSVLMGLQLDLPRSVLMNLAMAGLLHDVGKLDLPLEIINKPGGLTDEEIQLVRAHPVNAVKRLRLTHMYSSSVLQGIESHHERFDGSGYPRGLAGDDVPLFARILALADVFDALTSNRPYREAWSTGEAVEYMMGCSGTHFDCSLLDVFLNTVAAYPVGTVVRLSNESLAVVVANHPGHTLRPTVQSFSPPSCRNKRINLAEDRNFLNVTIVGTLGEEASLPREIFQD